MAHQTTTTPVSIGNYKFSSTMKTFFGLSAVFGIAVVAYGLMKDPARAWPNFLVNYFFFLSFAAFGVIFTAIQHVTNAYWSVTTRRVAESFLSYLPVALVLGIVLFMGRSHLYEWVHAAAAPAHGAAHAVISTPEQHEAHLLQLKAPYLNSTFWAIRLFGFLALWMFFGFGMRKNSLAQDSTGDTKNSLKNIKLGAFTIPVFGISFTLLAFDLLMSLEPTWFSTIYGVYCFGGAFFAGHSLLAVLMIYGKRQGTYSDAVVNENHIHDIGKMMFAFTIFWTYIMFSQLMLQWYANMPEEITYYIKRFHGGWWNVWKVLFVIHFIVPFLALVSRDFKRNQNHLFRMALLMLVAHYLDIYYLVMPVFFPEGPVFGLYEVGTFLGFLGVFAISIGRFLEKVPAIPVKDPRLPQCLAHHQ